MSQSKDRPRGQRLVKIDDLPQDHDIIVLMGKTRSGKSTFINDVVGYEAMTTTTSMESDTEETQYVTTTIDNHKVVLVDTVGFVGSNSNNQASCILAQLTTSLGLSETRRRIKGVLFLADIRDGAMSLQNRDALEFFEALIGAKMMSKVIFVTTHWCLVPEDEDAWPEAVYPMHDCETQLRDKYWASFLSAGAKIQRLDDKTGRAHPTKLARLSPAHVSALQARYRDNSFRILRPVLRYEAAEVQFMLEARNRLHRKLTDLSACQTLLKHAERDRAARIHDNVSTDEQDHTINILNEIDFELLKKLSWYKRIPLEVFLQAARGSACGHEFFETFSLGIPVVKEVTGLAGAVVGGALGTVMGLMKGIGETFVTRS